MTSKRSYKNQAFGQALQLLGSRVVPTRVSSSLIAMQSGFLRNSDSGFNLRNYTKIKQDKVELETKRKLQKQLTLSTGIFKQFIQNNLVHAFNKTKCDYDFGTQIVPLSDEIEQVLDKDGNVLFTAYSKFV